MNPLSDSQLQAIQARGNVLVVAGAGTGKTTTLVQRCMRLLLEENCSLDEVLMVTFTEAAAAQMRSRIRGELLERQKSLPENSADHIRKQLALLDMAHICTLHSFCLRLVRQHFYELGIDPAVVVLDERQTAPLISQTLDALFQRYYASDTPGAIAVHDLIRQYGRGSDEKIRSLIIKLHRYAQALDDSEVWLAKQEHIYQQDEPLAWREWFETGVIAWRQHWLRELKPLAHIMAVEQFVHALESWSGHGSQPIIRALRRIREAGEDDKNWPKEARTKTRRQLKEFWSDVEFLSSVAEAPEGADAMAQDWEWVRPHMCALLRLTREFGEAFRKARRETGGVDFADLEQLALLLLRNPTTNQPTSTAQQWRQRLRFIFVDECQDINRAQDAIIRALSREGTRANRFLVGDVKQSIYRFRLANPRIFCEYEELWRNDSRRGQRIPLSDNFRSREGILHFVNRLFAALMRAEMGGVAYEADVHLQFGNATERKHLSFGADQAGENDLAVPQVELHLIDKADEDGESMDNGEEPSQAQTALLDLMTVEREARLVGVRLRELRKQRHLVWDGEKEEFRPADWRDMVVLLRSPSDKAEAFAKEFNRLGIPLSAARGGFFESTEISDLLSLLRLIDNPLQDVPVLAVLRSPLVGLSLDELAEVRSGSRERRFWIVLNQFHQKKSPTSNVRHPMSVSRMQQPLLPLGDWNMASPPSLTTDEASPSPGGEGEPRLDESNRQSAIGNRQSSAWTKVDVFLRHFERWRELARQSSLSHCLETVLMETHYEVLLLAEPRGEERAANVRRLLDLAREYDPFQRQGLYRFLRFVEAQQEAEVEQEPASAQTENAVRLMSIHKSKGLEFPVVALAGMGGQFNLRDLRQDILIHERYGLCPKIKPPDVEQNYPSLPFWLARREEYRELLGEELRLLYVVLTRARDTLILTGTRKNPRWSSNENAVVGTRDILSARSFLDWLLIWLPQVTSAGDWSSEREGKTKLLRWRIYATNDPSLVIPESETTPQTPEPEDELDQDRLLKLKERVGARYPYAAAAQEPAIKQISRVIWQHQPEEETQFLVDSDSTARPARRITTARSGSNRLAAVDIGDVHHRFLETVPLDKLSGFEDLKREAALMVEQGALRREELEAVDLNAIAAFWNSEAGRRILSQPPGAIHREIPLTARFSPADLAELALCPNAADLRDDYFVARGKVDLAVILPEEIWILDFKTDRIEAQTLPEKIARYGRQVKLYALALGRIYRRPVTHRWLHLLATGKTVPI